MLSGTGFLDQEFCISERLLLVDAFPQASAQDMLGRHLASVEERSVVRAGEAGAFLVLD